jgi:hypothetical protein
MVLVLRFFHLYDGQYGFNHGGYANEWNAFDQRFTETTNQLLSLLATIVPLLDKQVRIQTPYVVWLPAPDECCSL